MRKYTLEGRIGSRFPHDDNSTLYANRRKWSALATEGYDSKSFGFTRRSVRRL